MAQDLKSIYKAKTEKEGSAALKDFEKKWKKYPYVAASWKMNWGEIATFFKYPLEIRGLIYTTNPIESMNRSIKKITKNKAVFPNEQSVFEVVYLALQELEKNGPLVSGLGYGILPVDDLF